MGGKMQCWCHGQGAIWLGMVIASQSIVVKNEWALRVMVCSGHFAVVGMKHSLTSIRAHALKDVTWKGLHLKSPLSSITNWEKWRIGQWQEEEDFSSECCSFEQFRPLSASFLGHLIATIQWFSKYLNTLSCYVSLTSPYSQCTYAGWSL